MNKDLCDITVVIDRSGSMQSCRTDAEGGLNAFIEEQKKLPGQAMLTLVQFDDQYEFVHKGKPLSEVERFTLAPRGGTALLDAVGRAITETGDRLAKVDEWNRPGVVAFVIITDGHENASREFTKAKVKEMVEHQTNVYQWKFTFLGTGIDAFAEAGGLGIGACSTLQHGAAKTMQAYALTSGSIGAMRSASASSVPVGSFAYTSDEREATK